jgi:hypothetical protein
MDAALHEIKEVLANEAPNNKEHVWVTGVGLRGVDGLYMDL